LNVFKAVAELGEVTLARLIRVSHAYGDALEAIAG
jgi:hypothetical protein